LRLKADDKKLVCETYQSQVMLQAAVLIISTVFVHEVFKVKLVIEILVEDDGTVMQHEELNYRKLPCRAYLSFRPCL